MEALELHAAQQGHTPQHVGRGLVRARRRAIFDDGLGSSVVRSMLQGIASAAGWNPRFLAAPTPALQRHARVAAVHSLEAADDYARRVRDPYGWNPWPAASDVGRAPLGTVLQRGNRGLGR